MDLTTLANIARIIGSVAVISGTIFGIIQVRQYQRMNGFSAWRIGCRKPIEGRERAPINYTVIGADDSSLSTSGFFPFLIQIDPFKFAVRPFGGLFRA